VLDCSDSSRRVCQARRDAIEADDIDITPQQVIRDFDNLALVREQDRLERPSSGR
jgi:hypothetical protein